MTTVTTYNASNVNVITDNVNITGLTEDTFVKFSKDTENFTATSGAKGDVSVAISSNNIHTLEITVSQTSPSIPFLDRIADTNKIVSVWAHSMNSVRESVGGSQAMITKRADVEYGSAVKSRTYVFKVFDGQKK